MKIYLIGLLVLSILTLLFQACAMFSTKGTELQPYQRLQREKEFEIRYYPEATIATITSQANSYKELGNTGFRKLAGYIFGGNEQKQQIAMTAPVHMEMTDSVSSMSFVMPSKYNKDQLPKPNNAEVSIKTAPAEHVAVIRFGGFASDRKIQRYAEKLLKALEAHSIQYTGNFRYLGYNPPFQLFGRKNEIMVRVEWNGQIGG
jgi:effector-binding domain-containing protein